MMPAEFDVAGRTVIVTGASRGIGKGIVRVLAEAGARVLVTALTDRYLGPLAQEMAAEGHPVETLAADATTAEGMERTVRYALEAWGHVDALVNNVGDAVPKPLVPLPDGPGGAPLSDEEWRYSLDINLTEAFLGCRAIGPHFLERRGGRVVNVGSFAGARGRANMTAYSAAKAGLTRFTEALALEWAPYGITVNTIAPGQFPDPDHTSPERMERARESARGSIPLGRPGDPREVGLLALYLVSDASSYMTGQTMYLDGGITAG